MPLPEILQCLGLYPPSLKPVRPPLKHVPLLPNNLIANEVASVKSNGLQLSRAPNAYLLYEILDTKHIHHGRGVCNVNGDSRDVIGCGYGAGRPDMTIVIGRSREMADFIGGGGA